MDRVRLAVLGAGQIGRRHAEHVAAAPEAELVAVVARSQAGGDLAARHGARWFRDTASMLAACRPDGVIVATPNQVHAEHGLQAVAAGVAALVEKPLADDVAAASRLVEAAEAAGVPLLTGHHRRHSPLVARAKEIVAAGRLGTIRSVHATCWFYKPDSYFDMPWRRERGAGPILLNLIHDVDTLRHLCGEVAAVHALESNAHRGHAAEETGAVVLRFAGGALGTLTVSDAVVSPWSWELTSGENPAYPRNDQTYLQIGGTHGSLALPALDLWTHEGERSWWSPMRRERVARENADADAEGDALALQVRQFCRVIRGEEAPLVSGREGLNTLRVVEAIKRSAATGRMVEL